MILQCDQCKTRFRLDDSKLKPGGVKVRCSKCRHVFIAGAEMVPEESEFDAILSGLGAQAPIAPEKTPQVEQHHVLPPTLQQEPVAQEEHPSLDQKPAPEPPTAGDDFGDLSFGEEAAVPQAAPTTARTDINLDFDEFGFDEEPSVSAPTPGPAKAATAVGFGELDFGEEASEEAPAATESTLDFAAFAFEEEPAPATEVPKPAPAESDLDFGAFAFEEEPAVSEHSSVPAVAPSTYDFSEVAFEEEPVVTEEASAVDFGALSFDGVAVPEEKSVSSEERGALDFGEFSFDEEAAVLPETPAPAAAEAVLDFGELSFEETPEAPKEPAVAAEAKDSTLDFGAFSFEEAPAVLAGTHISTAPQGSDLGAISFDSEPSVAKPPAAASAPVDFGAFSFNEEPLPSEPAATAPAEPPVVSPSSALADGAGSSAQSAPQEKVDHDFAMDFGPSLFGKPSTAHPAAAEPAVSEELPPLSIASRRKGRSLLTLSLVTISLVMVLMLSIAGFYLMQSGPAAFEKLGLGFIAKWVGMESVEEGRITIKNPIASFYQNKEAGELFVVTGEAVNSYKKPRASVHVKVLVYDKKGAVLVQKTAYCGNKLTPEQLATLPMANLDAIMNNQFGDSLTNLGVQPGRSIPFVVAVPNVPKEAADFGVEAVGSTVAGQ